MEKRVPILAHVYDVNKTCSAQKPPSQLNFTFFSHNNNPTDSKPWWQLPSQQLVAVAEPGCTYGNTKMLTSPSFHQMLVGLLFWVRSFIPSKIFSCILRFFFPTTQWEFKITLHQIPTNLVALRAVYKMSVIIYLHLEITFPLHTLLNLSWKFWKWRIIWESDKSCLTSSSGHFVTNS